MAQTSTCRRLGYSGRCIYHQATAQNPEAVGRQTWPSNSSSSPSPFWRRGETIEDWGPTHPKAWGSWCLMAKTAPTGKCINTTGLAIHGKCDFGFGTGHPKLISVDGLVQVLISSPLFFPSVEIAICRKELYLCDEKPCSFIPSRVTPSFDDWLQ